jgi:hypothetical protein
MSRLDRRGRDAAPGDLRNLTEAEIANETIVPFRVNGALRTGIENISLNRAYQAFGKSKVMQQFANRYMNQGGTSPLFGANEKIIAGELSGVGVTAAFFPPDIRAVIYIIASEEIDPTSTSLPSEWTLGGSNITEILQVAIDPNTSSLIALLLSGPNLITNGVTLNFTGNNIFGVSGDKLNPFENVPVFQFEPVGILAPNGNGEGDGTSLEFNTNQGIDGTRFPDNADPFSVTGSVSGPRPIAFTSFQSEGNISIVLNFPTVAGEIILVDYDASLEDPGEGWWGTEDDSAPMASFQGLSIPNSNGLDDFEYVPPLANVLGTVITSLITGADIGEFEYIPILWNISSSSNPEQDIINVEIGASNELLITTLAPPLAFPPETVTYSAQGEIKDTVGRWLPGFTVSIVVA